MSVKTIVGIGLVVFIIAGLIFLKLRNRKYVNEPGGIRSSGAAQR